MCTGIGGKSGVRLICPDDVDMIICPFGKVAFKIPRLAIFVTR
jgi:hypothetical protein